MNTNLTDITLVVDRSGSMSHIQSDAQGGVNTFIEQQGKEAGEALLTLVQFDTEYDFLHQGVPIQDVPQYELVPRGRTALLDAVGQAVNETGERLARMEESARPGLVIFVVVTDGHENSSVEFTKAQIKEMIELQQDKYNWQFTFLGANQDAFAEAGGIGIEPRHAAKFAVDKVAQAYGATAAKVGRMRDEMARGVTIRNEFTAEEREDME